MEDIEDKVASLIKSYAVPEVSLTCRCEVCKEEMSGTWTGEPPYTLVCSHCGTSYTVTIREQ